MERKIVYFEEPGRLNTEATLQIARSRAEEAQIGKVLVATREGDTALRAGEIFKESGIQVIAITHQYGYAGPGWLIRPEAEEKLKELGVVLFTSTMILTSPGKLFRQQGRPSGGYARYSSTSPTDIIADTLRLFCQGMKVCVEIAIMAADAGLVTINEEVIAVAGSRRGADTAVVLRPACTPDLFDLRILEILSKPRS